MTALVWLISELPRRRRNTAAHRWFSARHTCSAVTRGFFPPQPLRVRRHEPQHHQGQDQVPHQPRVVPPLVVQQPRLLLAQPERVLHHPAAERGGQEVSQETAA